MRRKASGTCRTNVTSTAVGDAKIANIAFTVTWVHLIKMAVGTKTVKI